MYFLHFLTHKKLDWEQFEIGSKWPWRLSLFYKKKSIFKISGSQERGKEVENISKHFKSSLVNGLHSLLPAVAPGDRLALGLTTQVIQTDGGEMVFSTKYSPASSTELLLSCSNEVNNTFWIGGVICKSEIMHLALSFLYSHLNQSSRAAE